MSLYNVCLVAVSGREQPVTLKIAKDGLKIFSVEGKELDMFAYESIIKWLPANLRTKNPGEPDCLDIQIETVKGPRDLRMRCQSQAAVKEIIRELKDTVHSIMEDLEEQEQDTEDDGVQQAGASSSRAEYSSRGGRQDSYDHSATPSTRGSELHNSTDFHLDARASRGRRSDNNMVVTHSRAWPTHTPEVSTSGNHRYEQHTIYADRSLGSPGSGGSRAGSPSAAAFRTGSTDLHQSQRWGSPVQARMPPAGPLRRTKENDLDLSPPRRRVDVSQLRGLSPRAVASAATPSSSDPLAQVRFLENMVQRLSEELARANMALGARGAGAISGRGVGEASSTLDGLPLPTWMKDEALLNPLLVAYDARITRVEGELRGKAEELQHLQQRAEEVVRENDKLRRDLAHQSEQQEKRALVEAAVAASAAGGTPQQRQLAERIDLLLQENELLVQQQEELETEITRLQQQLEHRTRDNLKLTQESAGLYTQIHQQKTALQELEAKYTKNKTSLRSANNQLDDLQQELATTKAALEAEKGNVAAAKRTLEDIQQQHGMLQMELTTTRSTTRAHLDSSSTLQVELANTKDRYEAAAAEGREARREADQLRSALGGIEARLLEYQRKDAEVYSRIREAMEEAEQARLARDSAASKARELERENDALQKRLVSASDRVKDLATGEWEGRLSAAQAALQAKEAEASALHQQVSELRATTERLRRERAAAEAETATLKQDVGEALSSKSRLSLASLTAMERIDSLERARDEAAQKLDSATRAHQRVTREWELERQQLQAEVRDLKRKSSELEHAASTARSEAASFGRQAEALSREVAGLKQARASAAEEVRARMAALQHERDAEVKALAGKLEVALNSCSRSVGEAERMIDAKEALLAKWKEEANMLASKLDRAVAEHRQEGQALRGEVQSLQQHLQALQQERAVLSEELAAARQALLHAQTDAEQAQQSAAHVQAHLMSTSAREDILEQENRQLAFQLDRAKLEKQRAERSKNSMASKYEGVLRQTRVLQEVVGTAGGLPGSPRPDAPASLISVGMV